MEYNVVKKNSVTAEVHFKVGKEELEKYIDEAYINYAKKIKIPGFRVGKAPVEIIKKNFSKSNVLEDAIRILITNTYNSVLKDLNPPPISLPHFDIEKFDEEGDIKFKASYEYYPEVKLPKYTKMKIYVNELIEDESIIEEILKKVAEKNYELVPKENKDESKNIIEDKDVVILNLKIFYNKKELYNLEEIQYDLEKDFLFNNLKENLLNKKLNDEFEFKTKLEKNIKELKKAYNKEIDVKVNILGIKQKVIPEINDEFAQMLNYENLESLKNYIKNTLKQESQKYLENKAFDESFKNYINETNLEVPEVFVKDVIKNIMQDIIRRFSLPLNSSIEDIAFLLGQQKEEVEKTVRDMAIFQVKEFMIIKEIAKNENIQVSNEEIEKAIRERYPNIQKEEFDYLLAQKNVKDDLEFVLLREKLKDFLFKNAEIEKKDKVSTRELYQKGLISL
ncbi:MAG: trigger factor [Leptonema sp. (in: bacteria)]